MLGRPFPHEYRGAFIDYHLLDIFKRLERNGHQRLVYLEDVVFEHMHYRTGKGDYDEIYRKRRRFGDDETFLRLRNERSLAAQRLLSAITATPRRARPQPRHGRPGAGLLEVSLWTASYRYRGGCVFSLVCRAILPASSSIAGPVARPYSPV